MSTTKTPNALRTTLGIVAVTLGFLALMLPATISSPTRQAHAELLAQNVNTWTLASEPTTIQLVGSGNYNDWHYVVLSQPSHGEVISSDGVSGLAFYQPVAGYSGVDSFTYKIAKNMRPFEWFSNTATVKIAVVLPWSDYYPSPVTPTLMADYIKAKGLTVANAPEIPNVKNIEPYKATKEGAARYSNVKAAWELSGQSWYDKNLTLGQKQFLMEQLPFKAGLWAGVYNGPVAG